MICFYHRQREGLNSYYQKHFKPTFTFISVSHADDLKGYGVNAIFLYLTPAFSEIKVPEELLAAARERGMILMHIDEEYSRARYDRERTRGNE